VVDDVVENRRDGGEHRVCEPGAFPHLPGAIGRLSGRP
jgi:hypothetical protein